MLAHHRDRPLLLKLLAELDQLGGERIEARGLVEGPGLCTTAAGTGEVEPEGPVAWALCDRTPKTGFRVGVAAEAELGFAELLP